MKAFDSEENEGEFVITVIPNIELQTRLLSYGSGIRVLGKGKFQQDIRDTISWMAKIYHLMK